MTKHALSRRILAKAGPVAAAFALIALLFQPTFARAQTELVMFEEVGCGWCEAWKEQIGPIYPKTDEAEILPLRKISIHNIPENLELAQPVMFTPTFVAFKDGKEVGRIIGFQSEDFFWWYLSGLADKVRDAEAAPTAEAEEAPAPTGNGS